MDSILRRLGLYATPAPGTVAGRLYAAVADLEDAGIYAAINRSALTSGDAWCDTEERTPTGMRTASCYVHRGGWNGPDQYGDEDGKPVRLMRWSFPLTDRAVAETLVDVFRRNGFSVSWDDEQEHSWYVNAVHVRLDGGRS